MSKKVNKYRVSTLPRQQDRIEENFNTLLLKGMLARYKRLSQQVIKNNLTPFDLIEYLQHAQINWNESNRLDRWLQSARFETKKTLDEFDFSYPTKINKQLIYDLAACRFIEETKNVIFLGQTGVGKTHLATALGIEATDKGFDTKFFSMRTFSNLVDKISDSLVEQRRLINSLSKIKLLILDEIALSQPNETLAKIITEILLNRHLKTSTIFTSNKSPGSWINVFGDKYTSSMVLDRIIPNAIVEYIEGKSYRLKKATTIQPS